jgi:ubiquinone/menaquinone biosynthesis C-methylase UbiE
VLEHLPDAGRALTEMVRVTRPRGRIVVFDIDWDTLIIDHPDRETTRTIVRSYSDSIRNGWIGRQLPRLFKEQHLEVLFTDPVQVFVHSAMAELFLGSHLAAALESVARDLEMKIYSHWKRTPASCVADLSGPVYTQAACRDRMSTACDR